MSQCFRLSKEGRPRKKKLAFQTNHGNFLNMLESSTLSCITLANDAETKTFWMGTVNAKRYI